MLQRSSFPSSATTELAESLQRTLDRSWLNSLQDTLRLPETWQQYLFLLAFVSLIMVGLLFQILLSVHIAEAEMRLGALEAEHARISRENSELIYQITMNTSLREVGRQAQLLGYVPATNRRFVVREPLASADALMPTVTASDLPKGQSLALSPQAAPEELADGIWSALSRSWQDGVAALQKEAATVTSDLVGDATGWIR